MFPKDPKAMKTPTSLQPISFALVLSALSTSASATMEQALYIDGKVRTTGVPLDGTRILVERDGIMVQMLTDDIGRVHLRLDLQRIYILSFERAGCMTKKLFFDTHVPGDGLMSAPFSFPFKVTLEENEESTTLHYAQPVGFIRYFRAEKDFGYDTNYRMRRYPKPDEELIASKHVRSEDGPITSGEMPPVAVASTGNSGLGTPNTTSVTASVRPGPVEMMSVRATASPVLSRSHTVAPEPLPGPTAAPTMRRVSKAGPRPSREHEVVTTALRPRPTVTRVITLPRKENVVLPDGRTEEVQVEPTYVTTTVRITKSGHTREYRRVAHKYGAVHFFYNGLSCGEAIYTAGINEQ